MFSAADLSTFGGPLSICGSRLVCVGLSENKLQRVCSRWLGNSLWLTDVFLTEDKDTSGLLHLLQVPPCTRQKIQFVLSFSFSSYFSSFFILMPNACNTQFAATATGFNFCDPGGSILSMHAHIQQQPDSYSVSFSYFFDWEQPNKSKQSSVTVPVGSSTAAAGDKLFGSRALRPLLLFNLVGGIQLVACTHQKCRAKTDA